MDTGQVLEELFDRKLIAVLKVLFSDTGKLFYLQEVSKASGVPMATCSRILGKLGRLGIIEVSAISRFRLYKMSPGKKAEILARLFKQDAKVLEAFIGRARKINGVGAIILHGKQSKDRANVLLIGENIDPGEVKGLCAEIKERHNFMVSPLSLTQEQYQQMSLMGLYSGEKRVLYEKGAV